MPVLRSTLVPLTCATVLLIAGCNAGDNDVVSTDSGDTIRESPTDVAGDSGEDVADSSEHDTAQVSSDLPAEFPMPDEYLMMRSNTHDGEPIGHVIEVVFVSDGTIEGQINFYEEALSEIYSDVEVSESMGDLRVTFNGPDFAYGGVTIAENQGHLDYGDTDTSHLPVYVHVALEENPRD